MRRTHPRQNLFRRLKYSLLTKTGSQYMTLSNKIMSKKQYIKKFGLKKIPYKTKFRSQTRTDLLHIRSSHPKHEQVYQDKTGRLYYFKSVDIESPTFDEVYIYPGYRKLVPINERSIKKKNE